MLLKVEVKGFRKHLKENILKQIIYLVLIFLDLKVFVYFEGKHLKPDALSVSIAVGIISKATYFKKFECF